MPAIINGLSVSEAQVQGLVQDHAETISSSGSNHESLFITGDSDDETKKAARGIDTSKPKNDSMKKTAGLDPSAQPFHPSRTGFGIPTSKPNLFAKVGTFGLPTPLTSVSQPSNSSVTLKPNTPNLSVPNPFDQPPKFNFWPNKTTTTHDNSTSSSTTTFPAAPLVQESKPPEGPPTDIFKIPAPFQTDLKEKKPFFGAQYEWGKPPPPKESISSPPSPKSSDSSPQVSLAPNAQAIKPSMTISPLSQWSKSPDTTKIATAITPSFEWPKPSAATQASQSDQKLASIWPKSSTTQESTSHFAFLNEPPTTEKSNSFFAFLNEPTIPPISSSTDKSKMPSPFSVLNDTNPPADSSNSSSQFAPSQVTPKLSKLDPVQPAAESSKNPQQLASKSTPAEQLPSLQEPKQSPLTPATTPAEQAKEKPLEPDPRSAVLEELSTSLVMSENGLLQQFVEYTLSSVVKNAFHQVKDQRSWERAGQ